MGSILRQDQMRGAAANARMSADVAPARRGGRAIRVRMGYASRAFREPTVTAPNQ